MDAKVWRHEELCISLFFPVIPQKERNLWHWMDEWFSQASPGAGQWFEFILERPIKLYRPRNGHYFRRCSCGSFINRWISLSVNWPHINTHSYTIAHPSGFLFQVHPFDEIGWVIWNTFAILQRQLYHVCSLARFEAQPRIHLIVGNINRKFNQILSIIKAMTWSNAKLPFYWTMSMLFQGDDGTPGRTNDQNRSHH